MRFALGLRQVQKSLDTGRVPKDWSTAYVCPLFKKGDTSLASNYRPMSLTSILCKVLDHIVTTNVVSHMDTFSQSAVRLATWF